MSTSKELSHEQEVEVLKEWVLKQPHLTARTDSRWLLAFLRHSKYSIEGAKNKIDSFYTVRTSLPEFFKDRNPYDPEIQNILNSGMFLPLPNTCGDDGPKILLIRFESKSRMYNLNNIVKVAYMLLEILIEENENLCEAGFINWIDVKNLPVKYITQVTPVFLRKIIICVQEAYPVSIKQFHHTNAHFHVFLIVNFMKRIVKSKLKDRIFWHSEKEKYKTLEKYLPKVYFPKDFGGENGSINELTEFWKKKVESYANWFKDDEKYGTDESLRIDPGRCRSIEALLGLQGTFKNLDLC